MRKFLRRTAIMFAVGAAVVTVSSAPAFATYHDTSKVVHASTYHDVLRPHTSTYHDTS